MIENSDAVMRITKRSTSKANETTARNVTRVCQGVDGSQPCSCYFTSLRRILQFPLSYDEITKIAIHKNWAGPESCEELKQIRCKLDGFYMLRSNTRTIRIVLQVNCILQVEWKKKKKRKRRRKTN